MLKLLKRNRYESDLMPLRRSQPFRLRPRSLADSLDTGASNPGDMASLANLVFDPSTPMVLQCRPAVSTLTTYAALSGAGVVSAAFQINNIVYGLIASTLNTGYDQPFAFNLVTNAFITVGGTITGATTPVTQPTTGDWTPPTMALVGINLVVTHPGFPGASGAYFGWFDLTNPLSPVWHAGNTTVNPLPSVPTAVQQFSNRAYFACKNALYFTDALLLSITNASQQLVAGDISPITALSSFNIETTSQGIVQALVVFKVANIFQVSGDSTASNLAINALNVATGTAAPRSVTATPDGIFFVAPDGLRVTTPDGAVSDPDVDVRIPFIRALYPSRISASYNAGVYRVCVQNNAAVGNPFLDYWYDLTRQAWTGPHSFRHDLALPYGAAFVLFNNAASPGMYRSEVTQVAGSGFVELGTPLSWVYKSCPLPDDDNLQGLSVIDTTLSIAFQQGEPPIVCTLSDVSAGVLTQGTIAMAGSATQWGNFLWGAALWFGVSYGLRPYQIPWTNPAAFSKLIFQASAPSALGFKIGSMQLLYHELGYIP